MSLQGKSNCVRNLAEARSRILECATEICALGVRRLAIFGSFASQTATGSSDVDVLVDFLPSPKRYDQLLDLAELLERILGRQIDLVTTDGLSPHLGPHILAEAQDVLRVA